MQTEVAEQCSEFLGVSPSASRADFCRAFEQQFPTIAPHDLRDWPFYTIAVSSLPATFVDASRHFGGWFHPFSYFWVRQYLPDDKGFGPTIIVNDLPNDEQAENLYRDAHAILTAQGERLNADELKAEVREFVDDATTSIESICRICVHEAAHAIDALAAGVFDEFRDTFGEVMHRPAATAALNRQFDKLAAEKQSQDVAPPPEPRGHGARFVRVLAHLDHRLQQAGVRMSKVFPAEKYGHPRPYSDCYQALGAELGEMRDCSFAEILASAPPVAFSECARE